MAKWEEKLYLLYLPATYLEVAQEAPGKSCYELDCRARRKDFHAFKNSEQTVPLCLKFPILGSYNPKHKFLCQNKAYS